MRQAPTPARYGSCRCRSAEGDDVVMPLDVGTAGELHHQRLVQGGDGREVEAVQALFRRELRRLDAALDHAPLAIDQLKRDGLDIESSQLETAGRLFNLAAFALVAVARTLQLVDARDGSTRPATDVIAPEEIEAAAAISTTLEGATPRQKNPHEKGSLAWLSWIAARLGGWNCYYKPPGPKTMARGLDRLVDRIAGYRLATASPNV